MIDNTNKKIKAVVFDFGGVIELNEGGNILKSIAELLDVPIDDFRNVYFQHNHLANVENMSWGEMIIKVVSVFDNSKEKKAQVISMLKDRSSKNKINTELLSLFSVLRRQGLKVGILSNASSKLRERLNTEGIAKLVDEIVISGEIGFQKPHKEAFELLFEKLKLRPGEVIFVDDTTKSLEKAHEIGYIPVLFKSNVQLKIDLRKFGIALT